MALLTTALALFASAEAVVEGDRADVSVEVLEQLTAGYDARLRACEAKGEEGVPE